MTKYRTINHLEADVVEYEKIRAEWQKKHGITISLPKMIKLFSEAYKNAVK